MSVEIKHKGEQTYTVNGKEIYKDMNDSWVARQELTEKELMYWSDYKERVIDNELVNSNLNVTYK